MELLYALLIFIIVGVATIFLTTRDLPGGQQVQLRNILLLALAIRLAAAVLFATFPESRIFHEDANGYEALGLRISEGWSGAAPPLPFDEMRDQNWAQPYLCGVIYYLLGPVRAAPSFFNALIGTMTVLIVFRLARLLFDFKVARLAAMLTAFTPSLILWSATALKDPIVTFLICISLYGCIRLKQKFSVSRLIGTIVPAILVQPFRFYLVYFLVFAILASMLFERGSKAFTGLYKQLIAAGATVILIGLLGFASRTEQGTEFLSLERVSAFRHGMATSADSGFAAGVDVSTPGGALAFLPIGLSVLLLGPFPWQWTSMRALMAVPETLLWWYLVPSMIRGIRFGLRYILSEVSPLMIFSVTLSCAYSLVHGNVGSAFRQRAQIFVFLFIFTAVGVYVKNLRRSGLDERPLLGNEQEPAETESQPATADATRV
jgi:hypothetical protein